MKRKEELNTLKEETLEQVVGGIKEDPGYCPGTGTECPHHSINAIHWNDQCDLPKESRTLEECDTCLLRQLD